MAGGHLGVEALARHVVLGDADAVVHDDQLPGPGIVGQRWLGLKRRQGMGVQEFRDYRQRVHVPLLLGIPEAKKLRRLSVAYPVRTPDAPEPAYDAVVEAWFENREEMNGFFASEAFRTRVNPDHANFMELSSVLWLVTEELVDREPERESR